MKHGHLSSYFSGVAAKRLSVVEANPQRSNQHEFNGSNELVALLGTAGTQKQRFPTRFLYVDDESDQTIAELSEVTWYDARAKSAERTGRSEHRLYFPQNEVTSQAQAGDLLLVGLRPDKSLLAIVAAGQSTAAAQLHWLFGLPEIPQLRFSVKTKSDLESKQLGVAAALVLDQIGVDADLSDDYYLDEMLGKFGEAFPSTKVFSAYARETLHEVDPIANADAALVAWMDREETLFRTLEKHLIGRRLQQGFLKVSEPDVDGFLEFSLSVQNRRKARAGAALENHLEIIFRAHHIQHERGAVTERNNKPDFLFPGSCQYRNASYPAERLTLLAAKTTAKDRWRQVTKEADRVATKHLLTLEPAISTRQTDQMRESGIQLVVPAAIHGEYTEQQASWLLDLASFISLARERQDQNLM